MPRLIEYPKADVFNSLVSWLDMNKPNVKYTLNVEYVKDGKKYEADCGSLATGDPVIAIMYLLLNNSLYSAGKGVYNPTVSIYTGSSGANVNASTSWLSTSYNLSSFGGYGTTNNFSIKFSTTISSSVSGTATISELLINFNYGETMSSSGTLVQYIANLGINTTACNVSVSAGSVVTWTLSGSATQSNSNAGASWYIILWNEIWAEFIAATGVSGAPTGLWQYPGAGTALFSKYDILLSDNNGNTIGAYQVPGVSNTAISNPSLTAGNSGGTQTAPTLSFTFTPTSSATLNSIVANIYVNGSSPSTVYTIFASNGGLQLSINNINQPVTANTPYSITVEDSVQVSTST